MNCNRTEISHILPDSPHGPREFSTTPRAMVAGLWHQRQLLRALITREILGRYRGSTLGLFWALVNPVLMLGVYTFVFSVVFKARWSTGGGQAEFALVLFAGLLIFSVFSECLNRAPGLIVENVSYVRKVVFPLEILPWVAFGTSLFHALVSLGVWLFFHLVLFGLPPATALFFPLVLLPLALLTLGLSWFLAALGVYLRDIRQLIGVLTTVLMFLTPIFYPVSAVPESYRPLIYVNPMAFIVEQGRNLLFFGTALAWQPFLLLNALLFLVFWLGFFWFQKTRKGFADVI